MRLTTVGRVARNSIAMSSALLIKRASNFVLYLLIARQLGVLIFGQFSLVYTFYIIFQVPAMFGLANLIIREVAKDKSDFHKYLVNGHLVVLMASLVSLGIWALLVHLLGYSSQVIKASYLLGLALAPFAMSKVCEAIFTAFERMQFITYAFALTSLARIGLVWLLLRRGSGLIEIVGLLVIIQVVLLLMEWYFIYRYFPKPSWAIDLSFCRKLGKLSTTFLGISIFTALFLRLNIIVLSKMRGEMEVGLYNAAFQLTYVFMLISMSLPQSVYPVLSRTYKANRDKFKQYSERSIDFLISIALPLAVCFLFLADSILMVYREEFVVAAPVMRILGWMLVPLSFNQILGGVLLASEHQRVNLLISMVSTVSLFVLSVIMIHNFGLMGAGVAALAAQIISFTLRYGFISRRVFPISIPGLIWKPMVASIFLAGLLLLIRRSYGLWIVMPSAFVLYGTLLLTLNLLFGGPLKSIRMSLLVEKSGPEILETET